MSRKLLQELNGLNRGAFRQFLDNFEGEPHIAWYPSAGGDFRDLLYLSPAFSRMKPATKPEPPPPDIFLHSDYNPCWFGSRVRDQSVVYEDGRTKVSVSTVEDLPRLELPLDPEIICFPERSRAVGRVLFLDIEVWSNALGSLRAPVVYVCSENEAFCAKKMLPCGARISHVIHVIYGGGCGGGGRASGVWLLNVLPKLKCEVFVEASPDAVQSGDEHAIRLYPELAAGHDRYHFEEIRRERWADFDATWNLVTSDGEATVL